MSGSAPGSAKGRQPSDVMDAIFEVVADEPGGEREVSSPRESDAASLNIAEEIDELLPITTPRLWIAIVGMIVLLGAGLVFAAGTPEVTSLTAEGRVVDAVGVVGVESAVDMRIETLAVAQGALVQAGALLATGTNASGQSVELRAPVAGSVWQILAPPGQAIAVGETAITLLPGESGFTVLVPVAEGTADSVQAGQAARLDGAGIDASGVVMQVPRTPLPGADASARTGLPLDEATGYLLVTVSTSIPLPIGAAVEVEIITSESTLLQELVNVT